MINFEGFCIQHVTGVLCYFEHVLTFITLFQYFVKTNSRNDYHHLGWQRRRRRRRSYFLRRKSGGFELEFRRSLRRRRRRRNLRRTCGGFRDQNPPHPAAAPPPAASSPQAAGVNAGVLGGFQFTSGASAAGCGENAGGFDHKIINYVPF